MRFPDHHAVNNPVHRLAVRIAAAGPNGGFIAGVGVEVDRGSGRRATNDGRFAVVASHRDPAIGGTWPSDDDILAVGPAPHFNRVSRIDHRHRLVDGLEWSSQRQAGARIAAGGADEIGLSCDSHRSKCAGDGQGGRHHDSAGTVDRTATTAPAGKEETTVSGRGEGHGRSHLKVL